MNPLKVFEKIKPLLLQAIPEYIRATPIADPLAIVRLYYYDTHAPSTYLDFMYVSHQQRQVALDSEDPMVDLWCSTEDCGSRPKIEIPRELPLTALDQELTALFAKIYEVLSEDEYEETGMELFRAALQSVARQLNQMDWRSICNVTDDFVIVPADGSMHFGDDEPDILAAIPPDRLALLHARGFLGPPDNLFRFER
jgi:hypothetical protein